VAKEEALDLSILSIDGFTLNNKMNIDEAKDKLDYFNIRASRLIQWCITETLHEAMEPEEL